MSVIPWPYRLLALAALASPDRLRLDQGREPRSVAVGCAVQQQTLQTAAIRERQAQATVKVVTQYVDRVRIVREKGETIIKEVPVYVPVRRCCLHYQPWLCAPARRLPPPVNPRARPRC